MLVFASSQKQPFYFSFIDNLPFLSGGSLSSTIKNLKAANHWHFWTKTFGNSNTIWKWRKKCIFFSKSCLVKKFYCSFCCFQFHSIPLVTDFSLILINRILILALEKNKRRMKRNFNFCCFRWICGGIVLFDQKQFFIALTSLLLFFFI